MQAILVCLITGILALISSANALELKLRGCDAILSQHQDPLSLAWYLDEHGQSDAAAVVFSQIEDALRSESYMRGRSSFGGISGARKVIVSNLEGVWKTDNGDPRLAFAVSPEAEVAAYRLDRLMHLNIVPVTVLRTIDGQTGSLQYFVGNRRLRWPFTPKGDRMRLLDYLIQNKDRRFPNWFVTKSGQQIAIDHGASSADLNITDAPKFFQHDIEAAVSFASDSAIYFDLHDVLPEAQIRAIVTRVNTVRNRYSIHTQTTPVGPWSLTAYQDYFANWLPANVDGGFATLLMRNGHLQIGNLVGRNEHSVRLRLLGTLDEVQTPLDDILDMRREPGVDAGTFAKLLESAQGSSFRSASRAESILNQHGEHLSPSQFLSLAYKLLDHILWNGNEGAMYFTASVIWHAPMVERLSPLEKKFLFRVVSSKGGTAVVR